MDQEPVERTGELNDAPASIRAEIAETREQLARHLRALKNHLLHPISSHHDHAKDPAMPTPSKSHSPGTSSHQAPSRRRSAAAKSPGKEPASKAHAKGESSGASAKAKSNGKEVAAKSSKTSSRGSSTSKTSKKGSKSSKSSKSLAKTLVAKTGKTLDTVVAGAVVGAITGAARNLADEPTAMPLCDQTSGTESKQAAHSDASTTTDVLGEMASGAALGALTGAAKVVMPSEVHVEPEKAAGKGKGKKRSH